MVAAFHVDAGTALILLLEAEHCGYNSDPGVVIDVVDQSVGDVVRKTNRAG
jgi:hypothetical protein